MVNGSHVFDKLTSISDALKAENMAAYYGVKPQPMFVEGGSQFGIYAMRSAGITRLLTIRTSEWKSGTRIPCWREVFSRACRTGDSR